MGSKIPPRDTAIIGAGLAGLTLALALHHEGIPATVFESRLTPLNIGGAVMLSPNALKVLDAYGLYDLIKSKGYNFEHLEYRTADGQLVDTYDFGSRAKYGYPGLRIYRHILIDTLVEALKIKRVPVVYGKKFSHVVSDSEDSVTFAFADGTEHMTSLLVGADGIHSTVRRYLYPALERTFIGMAGITAAVPLDALELPEGYHLPVTIMSPKGAFIIAPQDVDGSEVLIGKQMRVPAAAVAAAENSSVWEREFTADKQSAVEFLQRDNGHFPAFVQRAVDRITGTEKVNKWPFFVVPPLDRWTSKTRRVLILGDAAHAIPPSAGQGINQALEDVYILALLLAQISDKGLLRDALAFWQSYRQKRIDRIMLLNKEIDQRRMPIGDDVGRAKEERGQGYDLEWLYKPDFRQVVEDWIQKQTA